MGPSLARRVQRAAARSWQPDRVLAASRFSTPAVARGSKRTASTPSRAICWIRDQIAALPRAENVLFLAGRKFGTLDRTDVTWATNTLVPARVAEHFAQSRMVVFSTGNVYPLVPVDGPGSREDDPPAPVGEYAQSCLGRERVVEFVSRERNLRALIYRLNYAVDLRYGTLVDIARKVLAGEAIDLTMGFFNAIWQGDANSYALRSLELCASPPAILNVTGAGAHLRPRDGRVVRVDFRPPAAVREQRRTRGPAQRFEPLPRAARRAGGAAGGSAAVGRTLGSGWRVFARQTDAFRSDRWPVLRHVARRCGASSSAAWSFPRIRSR